MRRVETQSIRDVAIRNVYSTLIVSKARFCDKAPNPAVPEEKDVMEENDRRVRS